MAPYLIAILTPFEAVIGHLSDSLFVVFFVVKFFSHFTKILFGDVERKKPEIKRIEKNDFFFT